MHSKHEKRHRRKKVSQTEQTDGLQGRIFVPGTGGGGGGAATTGEFRPRVTFAGETPAEAEKSNEAVPFAIAGGIGSAAGGVTAAYQYLAPKIRAIMAAKQAFRDAAVSEYDSQPSAVTSLRLADTYRSSTSTVNPADAYSETLSSVPNRESSLTSSYLRQLSGGDAEVPESVYPDDSVSQIGFRQIYSRRSSVAESVNTEATATTVPRVQRLGARAPTEIKAPSLRTTYGSEGTEYPPGTGPLSAEQNARLYGSGRIPFKQPTLRPFGEGVSDTGGLTFEPAAAFGTGTRIRSGSEILAIRAGGETLSEAQFHPTENVGDIVAPDVAESGVLGSESSSLANFLVKGSSEIGKVAEFAGEVGDL